jgi:hypothetical protein
VQFSEFHPPILWERAPKVFVYIVIDAWVRVSLVGIDLITIEARVVVASIETYLQRADAFAGLAPSSRPAAA